MKKLEKYLQDTKEQMRNYKDEFDFLEQQIQQARNRQNLLTNEHRACEGRVKTLEELLKEGTAAFDEYVEEKVPESPVHSVPEYGKTKSEPQVTDAYTTEVYKAEAKEDVKNA